jgi:uncharacterized protein (TIGR00730 family)
MNICIFCAASDVEPIYSQPAEQLAKLIAEGGHTLVWGGSDRGLMKVVAATAQSYGGSIFGITMESLKHTARKNADILLVAKDLAERKALMQEHSDAIITLVGGTGTLDEMTEIFELRRHGLHHKPLVIMNTAGFYDGLRSQWDHMEKEGFLNRLAEPLQSLVQFAETPEEAMELVTAPLIDNYLPRNNESLVTSPEAI